MSDCHAQDGELVGLAREGGARGHHVTQLGDVRSHLVASPPLDLAVVLSVRTQHNKAPLATLLKTNVKEILVTRVGKYLKQGLGTVYHPDIRNIINQCEILPNTAPDDKCTNANTNMGKGE